MAAVETGSRGVSREQWLQEALKVLNESGIDHVTIHGLASRLGVSRSGFYWHFRDRDALLDAMLDQWMTYTTVVTEDEDIRALDPLSRLIRIAETVHDDRLGRFDVAMNHWALHDERAARSARSGSRKRNAFVRKAFAELGFTGDTLEIRTMLFSCHTTWEAVMFPYIARKRRRAMIRERVELLTRKE